MSIFATQHTNIFDAEKNNSIDHFRVIPMSLSDDIIQGTVFQTEYDKYGYLWLNTGKNVFRYDGYSLETFSLKGDQSSLEFRNANIFVDSKGELWIGDWGLYKFNYKTEFHEYYTFADDKKINQITEDSVGNIWLNISHLGLIKLDPSTKTVLDTLTPTEISGLPFFINKMVFDDGDKKAWLISSEGIYLLHFESLSLEKLDTQFDGYWKTQFIRDVSLDVARNHLWIGTDMGLLKIHTKTKKRTIYKTEAKNGSLLTNHVTTTFIDSDNNVWLGLDKAGVCVYQHKKDKFICKESVFDTENELPVSAIDDISEDANGNLWFSMNTNGVYRITPHLEVIKSIRSLVRDPMTDYFPHSYDGIVRENGDIWIATDGGGINIFNYKTNTLRNIKKQANSENSLNSDSVVSMTEDENGNIWIGTWAGGLTKIEPESGQIKNYVFDPNAAPTAVPASNNIFAVEADQKGGIWMSVWGVGLQYFDIASETFTNYFRESGISNLEIFHITLYDDKLFLAGETSLEYIDTLTGTFTTLYNRQNNSFNFVLVESMEEIWAASNSGIIRVNAMTDTIEIFIEEDGLANNKVNYLTKVEQNLWIATDNGLSILDINTGKFRSLYKRDGLISNMTSAHGEFIHAGDTLLIPNIGGVNVVDINQIPFNSFVPKTTISNFQVFNRDQNKQDNKFELSAMQENVQLSHSDNNFRIDFASLSFISPEHNQFKYRLRGWQQEFENASADERFARYTNIPAGKYTFEVYSSNSSGVWDIEGAQFEFEVLLPWWKHWLAYLAYFLFFSLLVYLTLKWRMAVVVAREKELKIKVQEKTSQLAEYTSELKQAGESLSQLNAELEERVERRTLELRKQIKEKELAENKLYKMAFFDSLTGLPNRENTILLIEKLIESSRLTDDYKFAVMFLDGDRFKQVNDTHGHHVGDELLKASSKRLQDLLSEKQHVGRLGGDEFIILLENCDAQEMVHLAEKIVEGFKLPIKLDSIELDFNVSIGLVECDKRTKKVSDVFKKADIAMYKAKEAGKNTYRVFDAQMQENVIAAIELEKDLKLAIANTGFYLVYQPLVNLQTGQIDGFEALIRWKHAEKGQIYPDQFIPAAEETGLIWDIGKWVLFEACKQTVEWHRQFPNSKPNISVNLSSKQLQNKQFIPLLENILKETGLHSSYLKLELTESVLIENKDEFSQIYQHLQTLEIDLAIDDFGTGYSSLSYLTQIPVQYLKIDRSFISAIQSNGLNELPTEAMKVVESTVSLGKNLGKKVTVEGIETDKQLAYVRALGCDLAQGYYLAKPLLKEHAVKLLQSPEGLERLVLKTDTNSTTA